MKSNFLLSEIFVFFWFWIKFAFFCQLIFCHMKRKCNQWLSKFPHISKNRSIYSAFHGYHYTLDIHVSIDCRHVYYQSFLGWLSDKASRRVSILEMLTIPQHMVGLLDFVWVCCVEYVFILLCFHHSLIMLLFCFCNVVLNI